MDVGTGSELRLALLLLLNAAVAVTAWRFTRRAAPTADWLDRGADAFVLFYLVQYLAVCLPGLAGVLGPVSMGVTAVGINVVLWIGATLLFPSPRDEIRPASVGTTPAIWLAFVLGYLAALAVYQRHLPVMAQDALTYHFPAAATWLRDGRLALFETWFFNPANTYSPLAGSAFIAWLLAPIGNDTIASYVQMPALVGVWFVAARLGREAGLTAAWSTAVATAVVAAQPFVRASLMAKDDLFVAMFFTAAVAGLSRRLAGDPLGPWRLGVAVGLMLATKYTTLLAVPVLLLAIDGTWRSGWTWRKFAIALGCVLALAGPWYLRNWISYGNPVFPLAVHVGQWQLWPGLFESKVSDTLRSWAGIWDVLAWRDDSMPPAVLVAIAAGWLVWLVLGGRRAVVDPVLRAVTFGPLLGTALFLWKAPYAEIRFLYPVFVLSFIAMALGVHAVSKGAIGGLVALWLVAAAAAGTGIPPTHGIYLLAGGVALAAVTAAVLRAVPWHSLAWTHFAVAGSLAVTVLAGAVYVYWNAYVSHTAELSTMIWAQRSGPDLAQGWEFVRRLPPADRVAYANTYMVYPLMGFEPTRPVEHVPVRRDVKRLADLPPLGAVSGDEMIRRVAEVTGTEPDEAQWLDRLTRTGAKYLYVERRPELGPPPELAIADRHPERFVVVFDNPAVRVYEIR